MNPNMFVSIAESICNAIDKPIGVGIGIGIGIDPLSCYTISIPIAIPTPTRMMMSSRFERLIN
ncbi:MAG: hypothetical protein JXR49_16620 [Acidobacteria bacterium]|nr:hypothetical protein [Acidobacteriota bacterium]